MEHVSEELQKIIKSLEGRISALENRLGFQSAEAAEELGRSPHVKAKVDEEEMEIRIGQFWLPKLGMIAFVIGILYVLTLPFSGIPALLPPLGGYVLAISMYLISLFIKKNFSYLSVYMTAGSSIIAFLATLRLHYFGSEIVIESMTLEFLLLAFVSGSTLVYSIRERSYYLTVLGTGLAYISITVTNNQFIVIPGIVLLSFLISRLVLKFEWRGLLFYGMSLSYLFHFNYFMNNPVIGNSIMAIPDFELSVIFILLYILIFGSAVFNRMDNSKEEFLDVTVILLNSLGGYGLFLLITLVSSGPAFAAYHVLAAGVFLAMACGFWIKEKSQDMTFILAMSGYAALSVSIIYQFEGPYNFILLCWQSLLVLATAVWFRSKFIIVSNFVIFTGTLIGYILYDYDVTLVALSFGLVGLISARILNWKRSILEFDNEPIRNGYLIIALIFVPYTFYWVFPSTYVVLALLVLALLYFAMGKLLRNLKYRYMAVLTLVISAVYLMILGFTDITTTAKIISFISAGVVLFLTSLVYSKMKRSVP